MAAAAQSQAPRATPLSWIELNLWISLGVERGTGRERVGAGHPDLGLLVAGAGLTYLELLRRGKPTRVYVLHMGLFAILLTVGWACATGDIPAPPAAGAILLMAAVLVRSGTVPVHTWVTDMFEHASFGTALLFATPIAGAYLAVRLVLPVAPDSALSRW